MTHIKGERYAHYDRLHHADGSHRDTARTADGNELDWFDQHREGHKAAHEETRRQEKERAEDIAALDSTLDVSRETSQGA